MNFLINPRDAQGNVFVFACLQLFLRCLYLIPYFMLQFQPMRFITLLIRNSLKLLEQVTRKVFSRQRFACPGQIIHAASLFVFPQNLPDQVCADFLFFFRQSSHPFWNAISQMTMALRLQLPFPLHILYHQQLLRQSL